MRRNVLCHLGQEIESSPDDQTFGAQIAEIPVVRFTGIPGLPITDVSWTYLWTLFVMDVTENDEAIEIAYVPNEKQNEANFFQPLFLDNRQMDVWIEPARLLGERELCRRRLCPALSIHCGRIWERFERRIAVCPQHEE